MVTVITIVSAVVATWHNLFVSRGGSIDGLREIVVKRRKSGRGRGMHTRAVLDSPARSDRIASGMLEAGFPAEGRQGKITARTIPPSVAETAYLPVLAAL
jgi:hypothetical protein